MPRINKDSAKDKEVEERREKVKRLHICKLTIREISLKLNVSERTVQRDIEVLRQRTVEMTSIYFQQNNDIPQIVHEYLEATEEIIRELWISYYNKELKMKARLAFMQAISRTYTERIKALQMLGLLTKNTAQLGNLRELIIREPENVKTLNDDFMAWLKQRYQDPRN